MGGRGYCNRWMEGEEVASKQGDTPQLLGKMEEMVIT